MDLLDHLKLCWILTLIFYNYKILKYINLIKMIEEGILQNGILTKEDIEEIHRVFVMMD